MLGVGNTKMSKIFTVLKDFYLGEEMDTYLYTPGECDYKYILNVF